jgi:hypothetical protein
MDGKSGRIDCSDIYERYFGEELLTLKTFKEINMKSSSTERKYLFKYDNQDFSKYEYTIRSQEDSLNYMFPKLVSDIMQRYGIHEISPKEPYKAPFELMPRNGIYAPYPKHLEFPFDFIINEDGLKRGYLFEEFYAADDVNDILDKYGVNEAFIIRAQSGTVDRRDTKENKRNQEAGIRLQIISAETFFKEYFGEEEWKIFVSYLDKYKNEAREILGYETIKFLSSMNLASLRTLEEDVLTGWGYKNYKYQIIDSNKTSLGKYEYISSEDSLFEDIDSIESNYLSGNRYKTMIGTNDYAESFVTSEWLYYSLKGRKNFDYTAVISGYLKSIEQLLHQIVMLNVDNGCKIAMKNKMLNTAYRNQAIVYEYEKDSKEWIRVPVNKKGNNYVKPRTRPYIDFTTEHKDYMDSSIGTFEYFIRYNPHIFVNPDDSKVIADMISCFRLECRNGFFHTDNLKDWSKVEKTRQNAIYLYFVLLGSINIPKEKEDELGLLVNDMFDELCMEIRHQMNYSLAFVFEYRDGTRQTLYYDPRDNTLEYSSEGIEHYESLRFFKAGDGIDDIEKAAQAGELLYLTRDNVPNKIFGFRRKKDNGNREMGEVEIFDENKGVIH